MGKVFKQLDEAGFAANKEKAGEVKEFKTIFEGSEVEEIRKVKDAIEGSMEGDSEGTNIHKTSCGAATKLENIVETLVSGGTEEQDFGMLDYIAKIESKGVTKVCVTKACVTEAKDKTELLKQTCSPRSSPRASPRPGSPRPRTRLSC